MQTLFYACINVGFYVVNMQLMCLLNINIVNGLLQVKVDMFPHANRSLRPVCYVEETAYYRALCVFLLICTDKSSILSSLKEQPAADRGQIPSFIQHNIEHNADLKRVNGRASNLVWFVKDKARPLQSQKKKETQIN